MRGSHLTDREMGLAAGARGRAPGQHQCLPSTVWAWGPSSPAPPLGSGSGRPDPLLARSSTEGPLPTPRKPAGTFARSLPVSLMLFNSKGTTGRR